MYLVSYIGRYSLVVLGVHLIFYAAGSKFITNPVILFAVCLSLSVAAIPLLTHLFPNFTAQKDLLKHRLSGGSD